MPEKARLVATSAISVTATTTSEAVMNPETEHEDELVAEDLIEEVSIDGMCGVY